MTKPAWETRIYFLLNYYFMMCVVDNNFTILPLFIEYLLMILIPQNWGLCHQNRWVFLTYHFVVNISIFCTYFGSYKLTLKELINPVKVVIYHAPHWGAIVLSPRSSFINQTVYWFQIIAGPASLRYIYNIHIIIY